MGDNCDLRRAITNLLTAGCGFVHISIMSKNNFRKNVHDLLPDLDTISLLDMQSNSDSEEIIAAGSIVHAMSEYEQLNYIDINKNLSLTCRILFSTGVPIGNIKEYEEAINKGFFCYLFMLIKKR